MAAYDGIVELIRRYYISMGYNSEYINSFFSNHNFKELISMRLANANLMIRNKTIRSSHQTHIAITGEAIDFFYDSNDFKRMDTKTIDRLTTYVSLVNLCCLSRRSYFIEDDNRMDLQKADVTVGKRTQKQLQLSKRNSENGECFNELRLGLYENDLLVLLKYRNKDAFMSIGIPQSFYLQLIPDYSEKYDANTYLRLPLIDSIDVDYTNAES